MKVISLVLNKVVCKISRIKNLHSQLRVPIGQTENSIHWCASPPMHVLGLLQLASYMWLWGPQQSRSPASSVIPGE